MPEEKTIRIRAYHLGMGESFLVQFEDDGQRSILIDFGAPASLPLSELTAVANDIAKRTGGVLDAVIITHEHADRISGFLRQQSVFDTIEIKQVLMNGAFVDEEEDEESTVRTLQDCRDLVSPFQRVLAETRSKVDSSFKYKLENNSLVETHLSYIRSLVDESDIHYLERTDDSADAQFSDCAELKVHSPIGGLHCYDNDYRQNQIASIHTRLKSRLDENSGDEYSHPMFGDDFKRSTRPSHFSESDFRTLRRINFILGTSEYDLVEQAIDNSALIFTLEIHGRKLLFAGDITETNWFWLEYCYDCCNSDEVVEDCPKCKEMQNQWANIDFCKMSSHILDYEYENEILKLLPSTSQLLLTKHVTGETDKLIRKATNKYGDNLTVINATPNSLWSDVTL